MEYDIIIIGGGPAGICAAIYALRANKRVLLLEKEVVGGKIISTPFIENYPGILEIKGMDLSENLNKQVIAFGGEIKMEKVIKIEHIQNKQQVITTSGKYIASAIILATGTKYKRLGIENEEKWIGKGISFCATCDGFFYQNKVVAVIGGGNTAVVNALELAANCKKVYLIQVLEKLTAEPILINQLEEEKKVEVFYQTSVKSYIGEEKLEGIELQKGGKIEKLSVEGVFLAIGQIPENEFIEGFIQTNQDGYIKVDTDFKTNQKGVFAAGDCIEKQVRQLTTAVNDGTIAALKAIEYLNTKNKE